MSTLAEFGMISPVLSFYHAFIKPIYKSGKIGFQTFTLPFGLVMLQARLAGAHLHGVSMDRNCWHGHCSGTTGPAVAVGLPCRHLLCSLCFLPAGSLAGSRLAEGTCCMCTHREACLCASFSSGCLCSAASTHGFWGGSTWSSVPAGQRQACRHWWCSGVLVPSAKQAHSFSSLDMFSRDQQRHECHFRLSKDDVEHVGSGAVRICNSTGGYS